MVRTWRERRTHEKHGNYIIYYDQYKVGEITVTEIFIDSVRKGKTIKGSKWR